MEVVQVQTNQQEQKRALMARIDALLAEAAALPSTRDSWERRNDIDWEIMLVCRQIADLSSGPLPYWAGQDSPEKDR